MGIDTRRKAAPPLPEATDQSTLSSATGGSATATDLATDVSRRTDRSSYSIPEDGSPITISTRKRRQDRDRQSDHTLTHTSHQSQTSLLIEYFEGGKNGSKVQSRPSVRVKVTPSAARKIRDTNEHIQITETGSSRKPSYTRRISLGPHGTNEKLITESGDEKSLSSYASATEESNLTSRGPPVEIEVMRKDGSDVSGTSLSQDRRYIPPTSDISSIPPDSFLDNTDATRSPRRTRSRTVSREEVTAPTDTLKTPSRRRSRSLSRERIAQKVIEKLGSKPRESSSRRKHSSKSRSISREQLGEGVRSPRRRSSRSQQEEDFTSGAESSLLTSQLSPSRHSGDAYSLRSGTSRSSINNPKLLETVEDAIRRLILPELTALKEERKTHQGKSKAAPDAQDSVISGSSASQSERQRRPSQSSSTGRPKVVLNRDKDDPGLTLSGDSVKGRRERKSSRSSLDLRSESSHGRGNSDDTIVRDGEKVRKTKSKDRHNVRDATAAGLAGGVLTAAALRHHDSRSSEERRERRKKRSKSHSRSASIAESVDEGHNTRNIPPLPMSSDIQDSELTRTSILTELTEHPIGASSQGLGTPIREVPRGSPREVGSPASASRNRTPVPLQQGMGTHHSNRSRGDLSIHSAQSDRSIRSEKPAVEALEAGLAGAGTAEALGGHDQQHEGERISEHDYALNSQDRGLSPIQSVASYRDDVSEPENRNARREMRSSASLSSAGKEAIGRKSGVSIESMSSSPSTKLASARRALEAESGKQDPITSQDVLPESELMYKEEMPSGAGMDQWYQQQQEENDRYRSSYDEGSFRDSMVDANRMTNYTDDSLDAPYLDQVTAGQQVQGVGANPEYRHTPLAVESAVASLHDPSMVDVRSSQSGQRSYQHSLNDDQQEGGEYRGGSERGLEIDNYGSPLKQRHDAQPDDVQSQSTDQHADRSYHEEEHIPMGASGLPVADDPLPEIGHGLDDESEINTNPSIIHGPIGGAQHDPGLWQHHSSPTKSPGNFINDQGYGDDGHGLNLGEKAMLGAAAGAGMGAGLANRTREVLDHYSKQPTVEDEDDYAGEAIRGFTPNQDPYSAENTGPFGAPIKDEGYISAANQGAITPEPRRKGEYFDDEGMDFNGMISGEDPFVGKHVRHLSGNSHGMPSPLYDSSTGRGLDRIQSKDVVALMDHLTVRDAQRNARDTEILVTLVRSAAEMRNSFEEMKRYIAEQDKMLIHATDQNTERSIQKIIQGPRPQPLGAPRSSRRTSADEDTPEDIPNKRRNVFRRALKGLSMRSSNDLAKIEDMLVQLLGEVEGLKAAQELRPSMTQSNSLNSYENLRAQEGYEPEGQAGTSSTGNQSGYFSNPSRASARRGYDARRASENRVSTVLEGDEELGAHEENVLNNQFENNQRLLTPTQERARSGSVPLESPPGIPITSAPLSNENTPKTERSKKHKSNSSSIFPKISRWSKTTASSMGENFKSGGRKERPVSEGSRSGSQLDYYGDNGYERRSEDRLQPGYSPLGSIDSGGRTPSPVVQEDLQEDPQYQAHRNSLNLQHPQPRQGPTQRYQNHLESQAQNYGSPPDSPASDHWGSNPSLARPAGRNSRGSPGADMGFAMSPTGEPSAPPRPPKIRDDGGPSMSQPAPKMPAKNYKSAYDSPRSSGNLTPSGYLAPIEERYSAEEQRYSNGSPYGQTNGSPHSTRSARSASGQVPQRKPTGPRPLSATGHGTPRSHRPRISQTTTDTFGAAGVGIDDFDDEIF
ncbi:MAG: hypothetical protein M1819_006532 [Sarea resinae]|nr:MAG: hypothetical protein M1819_006532 [Sarea resinae]